MNAIFSKVNRDYEILKELMNNKKRLLYGVHILDKEMFLDAELSEELTKIVLNYYLLKINNSNRELTKLCEE